LKEDIRSEIMELTKYGFDEVDLFISNQCF